MRNSAPPPVNIIPRSIISPANSGGVTSSTSLAAATMAIIVSCKASSTSSAPIVIDTGNPPTISRPRTSSCSLASACQTLPIFNLIVSAVCSPINKLCLRLTYAAISAFMRSPASRNDRLVTTSPIDSTAISLVPPPISITMLPRGWKISIPAPTAATLGSNSKKTLPPPDFSAIHRTADG